jgi:serine/threonine-protein kinase RsbT
MTERRIDITDQNGVVAARRAGREMASEIGLGSADQTRLATAISELTRNVLQYARAGVCIFTDKSDEDVISIQAVVEDYGPGIPDVQRAMEDGFSTSRGLGAGLPGAKRLVQDFDVESRPGHTKVTIAIVRRRS